MYKYISFSKLSNSSTWIAFYVIWGNYKLLICPLGSVKRGHGPRTATTAYKPRLITSSWMLLAQESFVIHEASVTCLFLSGCPVVPASFHHLSMYVSWHVDRLLYKILTFSEATLAAITGYRSFFSLCTPTFVFGLSVPPLAGPLTNYEVGWGSLLLIPWESAFCVDPFILDESKDEWIVLF